MSLIRRVAGNIIPNKGGLVQGANALVQQAARTALAGAFPDQYEAYQLTLQLAYPGGSTKQFTFPVMPESIQIAQRYLVTLTTTLGGNYVDDFGAAPSPIMLAGTFGKKVRPTLGSLNDLSARGGLNALKNTGLATGFGMVKQLSQLVEASHTPVNGVLPRVVLYNWVFNQHVEVLITDFSVQMDVSQNGLWFYQMQCVVLGPHDLSLRGRVDQLIRTAIGGAVTQLGGNALAKVVLATKAANKLKDVASAAKKIKGLL